MPPVKNRRTPLPTTCDLLPETYDLRPATYDLLLADDELLEGFAYFFNGYDLQTGGLER